MADILIKGMEKPSETRGIEVFMYNDGLTICRNIDEDKWVEVEAIELPPHGRLIDADALPIKDEWALVGTDVIWNAPTVLEAST